MSATVFCGSCGNTMSAAARFCGTCGEEQAPIVAVPAHARPRPRAAAGPPPAPPLAPHRPPAPPMREPVDPYEALPPPPRRRDAPPRNRYEALPPPPRRRDPPPRNRYDAPPPLPPRERYDPPSRNGAPHDASPPPAAAYPAHGPLVPASLSSRLGAVLVDGVIGCVVLATMFGLSMVIDAGALVLLPLLILMPTFLLAREGPNNGQSFGKQVAGIRVISLDGGPMTLGRAANRELLWKGLVIGGFGGLLILPALLNLIWPLFDEQHRALHDKAARTLVVSA